jgi:hypothetical protein
VFKNERAQYCPSVGEPTAWREKVGCGPPGLQAVIVSGHTDEHALERFDDDGKHGDAKVEIDS